MFNSTDLCWQNFGALTYPFNAIQCSGHGVCTNMGCICDPGWSSINHWFVTDQETCFVNNGAEYVVNWILWSSLVLTILLLLHRIYSMRPLIICQTGLTNSQRRILIPQVIMLFMMAGPVVMYTFMSVAMFGGHRLHSSWLLTVLMILLSGIWQINSVLVNWWFVNTATKTLHAFDKRGERLGKIIIAMFIIIGITIAALSIAALLAMALVGDEPGQIWSARAHAASLTLDTLARCIPWYYVRKLRFFIQAHLHNCDRLGGKRENNLDIVRALVRIRTVEQSSYVLFIYLTNALFMVVPEWLPYYIITAFFIGTISSLLSLKMFSVSTMNSGRTPQQKTVNATAENVHYSSTVSDVSITTSNHTSVSRGTAI